MSQRIARKEAARILEFQTIEGVRKLEAHGKLTPYKSGNRVLYDRAEVEALRDERANADDERDERRRYEQTQRYWQEQDRLDREYEAARRRVEEQNVRALAEFKVNYMSEREAAEYLGVKVWEVKKFGLPVVQAPNGRRLARESTGELSERDGVAVGFLVGNFYLREQVRAARREPPEIIDEDREPVKDPLEAMKPESDEYAAIFLAILKRDATALLRAYIAVFEGRLDQSRSSAT